LEIAAIDIVLVEVSTDAGLSGWGDAFSYVCARTTATAIEEMIAPQARGQQVPDAAEIPAFMDRIQRDLHFFGRYGITMFAISGLDIALWDLAARAKGEPLHRLIGARRRARIPAYASFFVSAIPRLSRVNARRRCAVATPQSSCTKGMCLRLLQRGRPSVPASRLWSI
jgi:L-alanine-DL-glutamate epimerase-like enolase superfamily enzyme